MKNSILVLCIWCSAILSGFGQNPSRHALPFYGQMRIEQVPMPSQHYQEEYTLDTSLSSTAWAGQSKGLHAFFGYTDELYFRSEVPPIKENTSYETTAWKGERVNIQLLAWSPDTLQQLRVLLNDLKNADGKLISKSNIKSSWVRFVVSNYPYGAKDATCGESHYPNLYLMPDRFEPIGPSNDRIELPGRTTRSIWLTIDIPQNIPAGSYDGTILVRSENYSSSLQLKINVQDQVLPKPHEWKHRLDIWQNPWVVAWTNHVEPWSQEHMLLLKKHLQLYADAGGTFITTYAVHSPWSDNSNMIEGGMIEWIKKKDKTWRFDYANFDKYVQLAMSMGIDEAITLYTPVPWGFRFRYIDEATGNYIHESWPPDSKEFKSTWHVFLTDLRKHLLQKGWLNKTYLGINENEMSQTLAAIKVIKEHSAQWKITYAGDWHPELDKLLDDYCFLYGKETNTDTVKLRRKRGQTTTYYVCCNPPVPNNFVYSPPIEGRWISWYTAAHHYDGFLRWAYDAWPADPARDARHPFWPAGDCYLVYPGGNSCIRFEKLREGIVDFEKIRIIRNKAAKSANTKVKDLIEQLEDHMAVFLNEKDFATAKIQADIDKGRELIDQISTLLK
jgi:hypothetical protein